MVFSNTLALCLGLSQFSKGMSLQSEPVSLLKSFLWNHQSVPFSGLYLISCEGNEGLKGLNVKGKQI